MFKFHTQIKSRKGFTLIELLVVIAIIGLLAAIIAVAVNNSRQKARDGRRIADLKQLRMALELSYDQREYYPGDGQCNDISYCWNNTNYIWQYLVTQDQFLSDLPSDPINNATYYYWYEPNAFTQGSCNEPSWARACEFVLRARLESGGYWYDDSFGTGIR